MALEDAAARAVGAEIDVEVLDREVVDRIAGDTQFEHVAGRRADLDRRTVAVQCEIVETGDSYRVVYLVDGIGIEIDRPPLSISASSCDSSSTSAAPTAEPTTGAAATPAIALR
ncbi:hypothetical protein [Halalkalicoccus salilacus]|uniref:hypothetical protein n=1 Tax=Halalkalicoccus sp. GCM10025704 TaxID=3252662 RepID=UPI00360988F5